jgi:type II secretory ATPase GspE/PulE/Tfp pilus assembly ATPase PilB-like protein
VATVEKAAQHRLTQTPQTITAGGNPEDFADAMQIALLEDPEVVVVRDIADAKTADLCLKTALAGRLVIAGFAANDTATAIERILQLGADRALLDVALSAVVSQRLARVLCDSCKTSYQPSEEVLLSLGIKRKTSVQFYRETGCLKCRSTGYKGRTGVFELLIVDDAARSIMTNDSIASLDRRKLLRNSMLRTLQRSGVAKVVHGVTSITEMRKVLK